MNDKLHAYQLREIQEYQAIAQITLTKHMNRQINRVCKAILRNIDDIGTKRSQWLEFR